MNTAAGLWIDHRKAIVVLISGKNETTYHIESNVEKHLGRINGKHSTTPFESQLMKAEDRQQRGFTKHLNEYYQKVASLLHEAEWVLILGPGEAKGELKKFLERHNHLNSAIAVESAGKMTDHQIAAKVRSALALSSVRYADVNEHQYA